MIQKSPLARILAALGLLAFASRTGATPLTFQFGGMIGFVEEGMPISNQVAVGMPYVGTYQFDPADAIDVDPSPQFSSHQFPAGASMSVDIGTISIISQDLLILVENSTLLDRYAVGSLTPFTARSILWQGMGLDLRDSTHSTFDSDELLLSPPDLGDFDILRRFAVFLPERRNPSITGTVDFLIMIPEPSSIAIMLTGVALNAGRRRHSNVRATCARSG